jgi:hypothetical protein
MNGVSEVVFEVKPMTKVLIYGGKTGWIGGLMYDLCKEKGTRVWLMWFTLC